MTTAITISQASKNLTEIVTATQQGKSFLLTRNNKPLAAIINPAWLSVAVKLIEKYDPGLADTLAISVNVDIENLLAKSEKDVGEGKVVPFA